MTPLIPFAVAAVVEIVAVATDATELQWIAKPLLAPLLIWFLVRHRASRLVVAAFGFAFAGDVALLVDSEPAFLIGMAFFLGTQVCLTTAFLRRSRPRIPVVVVYVVVWLIANALLWPQLGELRVPILLYSVALVAMAATAAGISWRVGAGGLLFLVSDLLIGMGAAGMRAPAHDVLVMTTYAAALVLIATGWVAACRESSDSTGVAAPRSPDRIRR